MASTRTIGNPYIIIIDFLSILIGLYGIQTNILSIELPTHLADAGHWQFLTNLSLAYSMIVFALGLISNLFRIDWLYDLKNWLHPIGLSLEFIVSIIYWPLRLFFLHLLVANPNEFLIPIQTDLSIHLMPVISLLIDYLVFMPKWTIRNSTAFYLIIGLTTFYWFLLKNLIDVNSGAKYPYAFMDVEKDSERVLIFGAVALVAFSQFLFMKELYDFVVKKTIDLDQDIDKKLN